MPPTRPPPLSIADVRPESRVHRETVLAAEDGEIPRNWQGEDANPEPGLVLPAYFPLCWRPSAGVKEKVFGPDEHEAAINRRGRVDAIACGSTPNYFSGSRVEAVNTRISGSRDVHVLLGCINRGVDSAAEFLDPSRVPACCSSA